MAAGAYGTANLVTSRTRGHHYLRTYIRNWKIKPCDLEYPFCPLASRTKENIQPIAFGRKLKKYPVAPRVTRCEAWAQAGTLLGRESYLRREDP
jgi:hypothetical protein